METQRKISKHYMYITDCLQNPIIFILLILRIERPWFNIDLPSFPTSQGKRLLKQHPIHLSANVLKENYVGSEASCVSLCVKIARVKDQPMYDFAH